MNKQIVRLLLKYTETMSHEGNLIQVIPNGYIEEIATEIETLVGKNTDLGKVLDKGQSVPFYCGANNIGAAGDCKRQCDHCKKDRMKTESCEGCNIQHVDNQSDRMICIKCNKRF